MSFFSFLLLLSSMKNYTGRVWSYAMYVYHTAYNTSLICWMYSSTAVGLDVTYSQYGDYIPTVYTYIDSIRIVRRGEKRGKSEEKGTLFFFFKMSGNNNKAGFIYVYISRNKLVVSCSYRDGYGSIYNSVRWVVVVVSDDAAAAASVAAVFAICSATVAYLLPATIA